MKIIITLVLLSLSLLSNECPQHLFKKFEITDTRELCYSEYVSFYSEKLKIPLATAELITREEILMAEEVPRSNKFHKDERLDSTVSQDGSSYVGSGFDRGHSSSSADMPTIQSEYESFSYANMTPQVPNNNRGVWKKLEISVRKFIKEREGNIYVINGVIPGEANLKGINIPYAYYKVLVYNNEYSIYLIYNIRGSSIYKITKLELHEISGLDYSHYLEDLEQTNLLNL